MNVKNRVVVCLLIVISLPALTAKAGGSGVIEISDEETYPFFFHDLAEGDQIQYSFSATDQLDVCFTTRVEYDLWVADQPWSCVGQQFHFGFVRDAYEATGTFEIPNVREYDDDWVVMLTNPGEDDVNVTYSFELFATYGSGASASVYAEGLQNTGTQELDKRGGALGVIFEALEAGSVIEYEFGTTEPIDLYVLPEEEWTLLEAQMGWDYAYAEIETMRGRGSYAVPRDATWVIVFVNYNQKDISLVYHVTAESPAVPAASAQSNLEANAPRDSKTSEDTNLADEATSPGRRASVETERPPMVQEIMQVVPTLVAVTTVAVWLGRKGKIQ